MRAQLHIAVAATGAAAAVAALTYYWLQRRRASEQARPLVRLPGRTATPFDVAEVLRRDGAVLVEGLVDPAEMAALSDDVAKLADTEYAGSTDSFAGNRTFRCGYVKMQGDGSG